MVDSEQVIEKLHSNCREYETRIAELQKEIKADDRNVINLMDQIEELTKWRPIETAPKNRRVLVTHLPATTVPPIKIAFFSIKLFRNHEFPWKERKGKKLDWRPTHWLPLPKV